MADENEKPKLADLITQHNLQEELNAMMAENRRKLTQQNTDLVAQLEQLKTNTKLTQQERDELQTRITQLEEQYMSKEELSKREISKAQKKYEEDITKLKEQENRWKGLYTGSTIDRTLQDAAAQGEAIQPFQVVELLRNSTQLIEDADGKFTPVVKFNDIGEDNKPVVLELAPIEAIKRMKELPERFGNLFKGTATSGAGGSRGANGSLTQPKLEELTSDPVKYAKWRKENPDLDISKLRR